MTDNPFALFWAWTEPQSSAGGETAGNSDEERPCGEGKGGARSGPESSARVVPSRRHKAAGCAYCMSEGFNTYHPPHDASRYCQSGGHAHCSCDTCF